MRDETPRRILDEGGQAEVVHVADIAADDGPASVVAPPWTTFGRIDVLHNNVGIGAGDGPPHHLTDEAFDRILDVNLRAMWRICREAVPVLRESTAGAIVNVSSLASIASAGNLTAYKISKAGVNALTQNLALTNAKHGVRANAVMPGFIDTPMAVDAPVQALGVERAEPTRRGGPTTSPSAVRARHGTWLTPPSSWPPTRRSSSPVWSSPSTAARALGRLKGLRPRRGR